MRRRRSSRSPGASSATRAGAVRPTAPVAGIRVDFRPHPLQPKSLGNARGRRFRGGLCMCSINKGPKRASQGDNPHRRGCRDLKGACPAAIVSGQGAPWSENSAGRPAPAYNLHIATCVFGSQAGLEKGPLDAMRHSSSSAHAHQAGTEAAVTALYAISTAPVGEKPQSKAPEPGPILRPLGALGHAGAGPTRLPALSRRGCQRISR